jgi:UPF0755 protein
MPPYRYHLGARTFLVTSQLIGGAALCVALLCGFMLLPPLSYPSADVRIPEGSSAREAAEALADAGLIRSAAAFSALVALTGSADELAAGRYAATYGEGSVEWLRRLRNADTRIPMVEVTIPEGFDRRQMAAEFAEALAEFDPAEFLRLTEAEEGYLFPDTYRFDSDADAEDVAAALRKNFDRRLGAIEEEIASSGRSLEDIVIMASLVERESTADARATVAGILWERMADGMPLQVDAPFVYTVGRGTADITVEDLASDDPYNTYRNKGLPPTPICSPGLEALRAAVLPEETSYRYFLTGRDGEMYYATTFEGHKKNRAKYLD